MQVKAKTNKDWYRKMDDVDKINFYNNMASLTSLKNFNDFLNTPSRYRNTFKKFIYGAFITVKTPEGIDYWEDVINRYTEYQKNFYPNEIIYQIIFNNIKNNEQFLLLF